MIRLLQRKLIIPRGDTGSFTIPAIAAASASDVAVFTIFDRLTRTKAFQKRIAVDGAQLKVEFNHNETVNLVPGHYVWDIKFYKNPVYADEELINGEEIDSYYAGYSLPECEIRETGDDLLISPDAAQGELTPEQLDIITAAITEASNAKIEAQNKAAEAATSADEADASARSAAEQAENAAQSATEAAASADSAAASKNDALASATAAAQSATVASNKAQEAEQSAIRAENAANAAEGSADAAESSATNAAGSAADAVTAKNSAQMSADDASQSAIAARQSAEASAQSASEANISKEQAQTAATNAATSENNASISANTASSKAGEAYMNSLTAERSAVSATASKNAAAQSEAAANTSRNEAQAAATSAAASAAQAQEYAGQLTGLTTEAQTLPAGADATASYDAETGVLTLGLPQGDSFHIVKTYASVVEMNADYNNSNVKIGDFVMITSTVEDPDNAKIYVKGSEAYTFVVDMSGASGIEGVSIAGIQKTSTSGLVDTYTITYTNDTTTTFTVTNGEDGDEYTVLVQANQPTQNTNKLWIPTNQGVVQEVPTVAEMQESLSGKADKVDTVLETTLSRGRKEGSTVGGGSFAFGYDTEASGIYSYAEGGLTTASAYGAHAEGYQTTASLSQAHAEGRGTLASGMYSHAGGLNTIANSASETAIGTYNIETPLYPKWVAGANYEVGDRVTRNDLGYECIVANSLLSFASFAWKVLPSNSDTILSVGNGNSNNTRSNAYALDWDGNGHYAGNVYVGANPDSTGGEKLATEAYVDNAVGGVSVPVQDVQVNGTSIVQDGVVNVPLASTSTIGVIKTKASSDSGLKMVTDSLVIDCAGASAIKAGTNSYMPIVPGKQDQSTFYGLAKAAGDTTQSQSSNFVGIYTDEAKAAINNMLGSATKEELAAIDYAPAIHATTSNNTFTDGVEGRPVACTIELKPTQAGSGTPSASNIRTITGYQEVYLWRGNGENHTALSTDPFTGGIGATAAKFVALSPFQSLEAYRISRAELVADKHYRLEFDLEISGTTETNRPRVYIGNTMPTSGTSSIATKINENNGHYTIDFNTNTQQLYSGNVFSFSPISFRNDVQNVQFTISNLTLIETDSWYFNIPEEAQDVYGESMSMDENLHLITVEKKAFFGGVFTIDTDGNTVLTKTHKCIRSYNGETLPGVWISDRDEYAPGTTPTTGALVVYELAEADRETYVIQKHYVTSLAGVNVFTSDVGTVSIDGYIADTKAYIDNATAGGVTDVQVNGSSVVTDGVANVPVAGSNTFGTVKVNSVYGVQISNGVLLTSVASGNEIKNNSSVYRVITPNNLDGAVFYGLAKAAGDTSQKELVYSVGNYTETAKSKISEMLSSPVSVSGTTPTITALSGIQYVCGEVATLDIALPASGIVDVVFQSGSTPTVLTITPPTGMTVEWANGFDSTSLEADTLYELNIRMVGTKCLGVAGAWS